MTVVTDSLAIVVTAVLAFYLRKIFPNVPAFPLDVFTAVTLFVGTVLIGYATFLGVYRSSFRTTVQKQYRLALRAYWYAIPTVFSLFYLLQWYDFPRRFTVLFFVSLPIVFLIGRELLSRLNFIMQRRGYGLRKALVFGYDDGWLDVFERFTRFPEVGYEIQGVVAKKPLNGHDNFIRINGTTVALYSPTQLPWLVEKNSISRIFIPSPTIVSNGSAAILDLCKMNDIKLKVLSPESEGLLQMAHVHDVAGIALYSPPRIHVELLRRITKRMFDVIGALILIALFSPLFVLTAIAILIESGRPIFFSQRRSLTKTGKGFNFYKFRSMVHNADEQKEELFEHNESDGALFKIKNDPRLTRVGKYIRKFSIDELPQLFNVLIGDMSLVGPRPLPIGDFEKVKVNDEFWEAIKDREKVKPGITGLWQISGRSKIGFKEMVLLDAYYVENQSLLFDIEILFETVPVVLFSKGAY